MNPLSYPQHRRIIRRLNEESQPTQHLTAQQVKGYERTWNNDSQRRSRGLQQVKRRIFDQPIWAILGGIATLLMIVGIWLAWFWV